MQDTIAAIATANGVGSISIIRLSGVDAIAIAKRVSPKASFRPRYADLTSLYDSSGDMIDHAIVIYFQSPHSFTGEDIVEFQCHGGMVVSRDILDTLVVYGARLAEPGEFSKRAFLNGKIDLTKAEAIAKLIESKSTDAAKILARQLKGELGEFINQSRDALLKASAYSEVLIDYAEEDIPQDISAQLLSQLEGLSDKFDTIVSSSQRRRGLIDGFRVAIVGKPNVGKSSLLNAFLSYDRAIVSDIAGTTRDTIEEQVTIGSHIIRLIDTAGIRDKASDQIEEIGIARSKSAIEDADIIIALFDGSAIFDEQDRSILDLVERYHDKDTIIAINKSDLIQQIDREIFGSYQTIDISAKHNFEILLEELLTKLDSIGSSDELMLISARQIEAVKRSTVEIHNAKEPLSRGELEFFSYHLMEAIKHLSSITTPYNNEEILDKMFGEFCLGK